MYQHCLADDNDVIAYYRRFEALRSYTDDTNALYTTDNIANYLQDDSALLDYAAGCDKLTADVAQNSKWRRKDPFAVSSIIPLIVDYDTPMFVRKRNERERERVRCVNDGYTKLRDKLPFRHKDKRVSKVEILRMAIRYIRHLQHVLEGNNDDVMATVSDTCLVTQNCQNTHSDDVDSCEENCDVIDLRYSKRY